MCLDDLVAEPGRTDRQAEFGGSSGLVGSLAQSCRALSIRACGFLVDFRPPPEPGELVAGEVAPNGVGAFAPASRAAFDARLNGRVTAVMDEAWAPLGRAPASASTPVQQMAVVADDGRSAP